MSDGIVYAMFGVLTVTVAAIVWVMKYFATELSVDLKEHTRAADRQSSSNDKLSKAVDKNTQASGEMVTFMKALNGKLGHITRQAVDEQNIAHQTVIKMERRSNDRK